MKGEIAPFNTANESTYYYQIFKTLAEDNGFDMDIPLKDAPKKFLDELLYGTKRTISFKFHSHYQDGIRSFKGKFEGIIPNLERRYRETNSDYMKDRIDDYMAEIPCPKCKGHRLKEEVLAVKVGGLNIAEFTHLSISKAIDFVDNLDLDERQRLVGHQILKEIKERLSF